MELSSLVVVLSVIGLLFYLRRQEQEVRKDINESLGRLRDQVKNCTCQPKD